MPTIRIGQNSTDTYAGLEDATIYGSTPGSNYGAAAFLGIGQLSGNPALIKPTVQPIPTGRTVSDVRLGLYREGGFLDPGDRTLYAYEVQRVWNAGSGDGDSSTAGWVNWTSARRAQLDWAVPGARGAGDSVTSAAASIAVTNTNGYVELAGAGMVAIMQAAVNAGVPPLGWLLAVGVQFDWVATSSEGPDGQRPYLQVTFSDVNPWNLAGTGPRSDGSMAAGPMAGGALGFSTRGIFVPSEGLGKVWDGSAWVAKPVKHWTGSAWVQKPAKHWNGSAWQ